MKPQGIQRRHCAALIAALGLTPPASASPLRLDDTPPEALGTDVDGRAHTVAEGLGKIQMVCFWASWCGYCKQLMPVLESLQRRVGPDAMRTLLITGEARSHYKQMARHAQRELQLRILHDESNKLSSVWGGSGYPYLVVVGPDGRVRESFSGYSEQLVQPILNEVNGALRELAAAKPQG